MRLHRWLVALLWASAILAQLPPPAHAPPPPPAPGPRPAPPPPAGRAAIRRKLSEVRPTGPTEAKLLALARMYLDRSDHNASENPFAAGRDLVAADALVHAAEHQQHIVQRTGPAPAKEEIARHLERVYFRLQQADYFVRQSDDANARSIAKFAGQYYQSALRAQDQSELHRADECAKSADDLMRALESLAQATVLPPPAPGPHPPAPPEPPRKP